MSSTMTTIVKNESTSPKISDMDKSTSQMNTSTSMLGGPAITRKRPEDSTPLHQSRDMNYFGIRVADIGGVSTAGCGNIYIAGSDLIPGGTGEDLSGISNLNRTSSSFWQYPNALESIISMSPIGLQYAREPSRGQLVFLPTTSGMEPFPQGAFLWPPYMQQNPGALQTTPNLLFSSMFPQTNAPTPSYTAPIQFLGSNYLTTAATSSTVCHHSQANASRFLSISSDTRRIEQSQKHIGMERDEWFHHNSLNQTNFTTNLDPISKADKSKYDQPSYSQSNANLIGQTALLPNDQSHIMLNNTHSPPELLTIPMIHTNYRLSPNIAQMTSAQIADGNNMNKSSAVTVSGLPKSHNMQDVNIQTDTPVCSDDENSALEATSSECISCNFQSSEKIKSISTEYHYNYNGCNGSFPQENSINSMQQYTTIYKPTTPFSSSETFVYENEYMSHRSATKIDSFNIDCSTVLSNAENSAESSTVKTTTNPPLLEMSGLELLSNISTGSYINHDSLKVVRVKQEPTESVENESCNNCESYDTSCNDLVMQYGDAKGKNEVNDSGGKSSTPRCEKSFGGLNLLCALAEQRIQEEVESNNCRVNTKEHSSEVKKRKHKHSKSKSSRFSRYYKERRNKSSKERKWSSLRSDFNDVDDNLRSAFEKMDPGYKKSNKWPDAEDFFKAMESDMRIRLADITRKYRKKKRKLDEINKVKKRKKTSEYKFANISCKNSSFICFLDKFQPTSSNFPPPAEETEIKSINIQNKNIISCTEETSKDNVETSTSLVERTSTVKFSTSAPSDNSSIFSGKRKCKNKKLKKKNVPIFTFDKITLERSPLKTKFQQEQDIKIKEENKFAKEIDKKIVLSNEHLYREETRVLTDMGGLFYAGILKPLQPPDVYAITLDGERGNKSHIMSREEIFKDTILEVVPKTVENVPSGTRLCAYWSQQYRCLYPGKAMDSDNTDPASDFVSVEFDDGDSGKIRLQNIRYLLSDYPIVEYNENPFNNLGKNKKSTTVNIMPNNTTTNEFNKETIRESTIQKTNHLSVVNRIETDRRELDNTEALMSNISERVHKRTKRKRKKKHKKHHHKSSTKNSSAVINADNKDEEDENAFNANTKLQEFNYKKLQSNRQTNEIIESKEVESNEEDKTKSVILGTDIENEITELEDEDSNLNVVCETSDEAKSEKIDYNSGKGSKIAAFLPERQLWGWLGQAYRKGGSKKRVRKLFYKSISRGKETITVGECAVFLSTGRPDRPYIGRIEAMWETTSCNKIVRVRWFYHPDETIGCPNLKYPGALFGSPHEDENDVQTISHKCEVVEFSVYIAKFRSESTQYQTMYDNNDTYYLCGYYNPRLQTLKMEPDIPTLNDTSL